MLSTPDTQPPTPSEATLPQDQFSLLVDSVQDYAIFMLDTHGVVQTWNQGAERLKGYRASEIIGQHFSRFYPEEERARGKPEAGLRIAAFEGRYEDEGWRLRKDGSGFWASVVITAIHDRFGQLIGFAKITRDLTERVKAEEHARQLAREEEARREAQASELRLGFLAQASKALSESLDYETTLNTVTRLAVPRVADWCCVRLLQGDELKLIALGHPDPEKAEYAREMIRRFPADPEQAIGDWGVVRTGEPAFLPVITDESLSKMVRSPEQLTMMRQLGAASAIIAPLVAVGRTLGTLSLVRTDSSRPFSSLDLSVAVELAGRCAVAIDNARVHRELEEALAQKEAALGERERLLGELELERERLMTIVREMPAGFVMAEAPTGRFAIVNEQARQMIGTTVGEHIGVHGRYTALQSDGKEYTRDEWPLSRALHRGEFSVSEEVQIVCRDGTRKTLLLNAAPIRDSRGPIVAAVATFQDITGRKHAEELLERQAHFREQFIGILGHDLRNPLSAISVASQLLLRQGLPETQTRLVSRIAASADRMVGMISDLLDLTRARLGGGIPVTPRIVNLRDVCRHVVEEHELAHPEGAISFDTHGSFWGEWDPDRIAQVLSNLVGNALEHGSQATPVRVSLSEAGPEAVRFAVHNEGPAIPAETLPLLFDPFRRGAQTGSGRGSRGLGLGLYI
ncbi:MAG: PAS domain S-box protein, partial [Myxococcaceae bacterium]